jgi:hypothetical protein
VSRGLHLVGSVPMATGTQVMETLGAAFGPRLRRVTDGETGERQDWIIWLEKVFARHPAFERTSEQFRLHATAPVATRYRVKPGIDPDSIVIDNLYYAAIAAESYRDFARLKAAGTLPPQCRFQVTLAPAHSVLWLFVQEDQQLAIDRVYNRALIGEIEKMARAIPHDQLAIQIDIASAVFARLERGAATPYGRTKAEMQEIFTRKMAEIGNAVPRDIELLFHLCYGDANHKHVIEPTDSGDMVEFVNRLNGLMTRPIQLIHMPVPRNRSDDAYFAPLKQLRLQPETELCLGLVHYTDGVTGTRRRIAAAEKMVMDFSIATECGFGRRKPETIPELLRIHVDAAA